MDFAELVGWGVFALLIGLLGAVLVATWRQLESEAREAGMIERRDDSRDGGR